MISFYKRLFLRKRQKRFDAFNVLLKMLLKRGKFSMAYFLMDKLFSILKVYIYTFWQKRKLERIVKFNNNYKIVLTSFNTYNDMLKFWLSFVKILYNSVYLQKRAIIFCLYFFVRRLKNFLPKFSFFCKFFSNINLPETDTTKNSYMRISNFSERLFFYKPVISRLNSFWQNSLSVFCTCFFSIYLNFIDNNFSNKVKSFSLNIENLLKNEPIITLFFSLYRKYVYFLIKLIKYKNIGDAGRTTKIYNFTNLNSFFFFSNYNSNFLKSKVSNFWLLFVFFCFLKKLNLIGDLRFGSKFWLILFLKFLKKDLTITKSIKLQKRQYRNFSIVSINHLYNIYSYKQNLFSIFNFNQIFLWSFGFFFLFKSLFSSFINSVTKIHLTFFTIDLKNKLFILNLSSIFLIKKKYIFNNPASLFYKKFFLFVNKNFNFFFKGKYSKALFYFREKNKIFLFKKLNHIILFLRRTRTFFYINFFYYYLFNDIFFNYNRLLKFIEKRIYSFSGSRLQNTIKFTSHKITFIFTKWVDSFLSYKNNALSVISHFFSKYSLYSLKVLGCFFISQKNTLKANSPFESILNRSFIRQLNLSSKKISSFNNRFRLGYLKKKNIVNKNFSNILKYYKGLLNFDNLFKKFNIKFFKNNKRNLKIFKMLIFKSRFFAFLI